MRKTLLYIGPILFFFLQCTSEQRIRDRAVHDSLDYGQTDTIHLTANQKEMVKPMSELYEIVEYIPLETSDSILIGEISKLIVVDSQFWILDRITEAVYGFTKKGKFITKIAHKGRGPGEYSVISDISVRNNDVFIYDARFGKMLQYSIAGELVKETTGRISSSHFEAVDSNFVFYCDYLPNEFGERSNHDYNLIITDLNLHPISAYLKQTNNINPEFLIGNNTNISRNGHKLSIFESYRNVLYHWENNDLTPGFVMDFPDGNNQISERLFKMTVTSGWSVESTMKFELDNQFCRILSIQENDSCLLMSYHRNQYYYNVIHEKSSGKTLELQKKVSEDSPPISIINDLDNTMYYPIMAGNGDVFFSMTDPYQLGSGDIMPERVSNLLANLTENSNPILVKIRIKPLH